MRAIGCCPIRIDALDAYGEDGPRIGSPIDGSAGEDDARVRELGGSHIGTGVWKNDAVDDDAGRRESVSLALNALKRRSRTMVGATSRGGVDGWVSASASASTRDVSVRAPAKPRRGSRATATTSGVGFAVRSSSVDFSPLSRPESALEDVINALEDVNGDVEWEEKLRAIEQLAHRLVLHHQRVVSARLRPFIVAVVTGIESLRSCVAKASLSLVKTMVGGCFVAEFVAEVDYVLPSVLKRAAEMNFLSHDANEILHLLAKHVSPVAMIRALRRQASTRRFHSKVAMCLALCAEGSSETPFWGRQGCVTLDHALDTLEHCLKSGNRDAREYAKRCLRGIREATNADGWDKATKRFPELCAEFDECL